MEFAEVEAQVYEQLLELRISLADDPETMGPGYIAQKIKQCADAISTLNQIFESIRKELALSRNLLRDLELEHKVSLRDMLLSDAVRDLENTSIQEKIMRAEIAIEQNRRARFLETWLAKNAELEAQGLPPETDPPVVPTLESRMVQTKNVIEDWSTLLEVIKEKRAELKQVDSAVRLQNTSLDQLRSFHPRGPQPIPTSSRTASARTSRTRPSNWREEDAVEIPAAWQELTGEAPNDVEIPAEESA